MLFVTRVRHAGMVMLLGVVVALFYLLTGNTVFSSIGIIVLAVLAEVVLGAGVIVRDGRRSGRTRSSP